EDGFEIFVNRAEAVDLWRLLLERGSERGLVPVGLGARDTLRLEARLPLYGNDIDETTTPLEAGLQRFVKLDGPDFCGRAARIRHYAQDELGDVVYVELPDVGRTLGAGERFGSVESVKTVSDLYAPASGGVVEVNTALADHPELINSSPYGEGWMIKLRLSDSS